MVDEANEPIPYTVVTDGQWKRVNKSRVQVPIVLTVLPRDIRRITSVKGVLELLRGTTHQAEIIVPNTNVSSWPSTRVLKNALLTIKVYPVEVIEKKFSKGYRLKLVVSGHTGNYLGARVLTSDRQVVRTRSDKIIRPKPGETATLQHTLDLWHAPPGPLEVQVEVLSDSSTVQGRFSLTDIPLP